MERVISIGHRGACGYEEENTYPSFDKALELKVDMIEFDIQLTADEIPVVLHDSNLQRTTGYKQSVQKVTCKRLSLIKTVNGREIPLLEDVLKRYADKVELNIELKANGSGSVVANLINRMCDQGQQDNLLISSFNHNELADVRAVCPNIRIGLLYFGLPLNLTNACNKLNPYSIHFNKEFYSKRFIRRIHELDKKAFVYTCDTQKDIDKFKNLGVDGIFTGYPDLI